MKILMIGQTSAVYYRVTIVNPHKIMLTIDKHPDHITIDSKMDHMLIGKDRGEEIEIKKDGRFHINNLFS